MRATADVTFSLLTSGFVLSPSLFFPWIQFILSVQFVLWVRLLLERSWLATVHTASNKSWACRPGNEAIFVCLLRNAEVPHSAHRHSYSFSAWAYSQSKCHPCNNRTWTAIYITRFYGANDYGFWGCMMNILIRLWIHIHHTRSPTTAKIDELPKWLYSWQVLTCFLWGSSACMHSRTH